MTIREIIDTADELKPNAISDKLKCGWLSTLEGRIAAEVMLMSTPDIRQLRYRYPEDMQTETLVTHPHEDLYVNYLLAMIDFANGEYDRYLNSMEMFNASYLDFTRWFAQTYDPAQGYYRRGTE